MKKQLKGEPIPLAYYGRHNLPQVKTKIIPMSTIINRDFYKSLRKRGSTHIEIMNSIQPERYNQFLEDVTPVIPETTYGKKKSKISWWSKFKLLFTLSLLVFTVPLLAQVPKTDIVSVVSAEKDTLFLANNALGCEIMEVWVNYPQDRPIIILKSEDWIIRENNKRKKEKEN